MEVYSAPLMAALILTISIIYLLQKKFKPQQKPADSPPGPRGLPIVGYLPFLRHDLHHQLTELAAQYGPIYRFRLGTKLCTVITSASLAKEVFRDHDAAFANRDITVAARIATYNFNDIAFAPHGHQWRDRRKIFAQEMLSNPNLKASRNLRKDQVRKAVREIHRAQIETPVRIFELALGIDLHLLISMIWGGKLKPEQIDGMSEGLMPIVAEMLDLLVKPNLSDFFPVLARFDFQGVARRMSYLLREVEAITKSAIEERIKNPRAMEEEEEEEGRKDFMQTLVDLMHQQTHNASTLGIVQIKAMLIRTEHSSWWHGHIFNNDRVGNSRASPTSYSNGKSPTRAERSRGTKQHSRRIPHRQTSLLRRSSKGNSSSSPHRPFLNAKDPDPDLHGGQLHHPQGLNAVRKRLVHPKRSHCMGRSIRVSAREIPGWEMGFQWQQSQLYSVWSGEEDLCWPAIG